MKPAVYRDVQTGARLASEPGPDCLRVGAPGKDEYLVGPAFFDPQVNGYAGVDFQNPELDARGLRKAVESIRAAGCSHILLTLISGPPDFLAGQFERIASFLDGDPILAETIPGFHLEGPFLLDEEGFRGAHSPRYFRPPDRDLFDRLQRAAGGRIRMITLAPELPGAISFIRDLTRDGVRVALGHTNASTAELEAAVDAGARLFTHLGNGCPMMLPRHDNIIQRVLAIPDLTATLIPDGVHIPAPALGNLVRCLGPDRLYLTTDSMSAAAAAPGEHALGELSIRVGEDGIVRNRDSDQLAGSSLRMVDGFFNAMKLGGLDAATAWRAWTGLRDLIFPEIDAPDLALAVGASG